MRGFDNERNAARKAIETLRHIPVMAEDFGAVAASPQQACLDGVRQSQVYVGIFGPRYGTRVASGMSPTEEEFREAERRGLDILCFVFGGSLEPDQKKFIDSIKSYEHGKMLAFYQKPEDLKDLVIQGINDLSAAAAGGILDVSTAQNRLESKLPQSQRYGRGDPELHVAVIPERQADEYFSPHDLGDVALRERVEQLLLYGPHPRLFSRELGIKALDGEQYLQFFQEHPRDTIDNAVSLYGDGTIILSSTLREPERRRAFPGSMIRGFVVDEEMIANRLSGFYALAEQIYAGSESCRYVSAIYTWMILAGMKNRTLGKIPNPEPNSFEMASHSLDDPVCIPAEPVRIVRKQLLDPAALTQDILARTIRKFRAAGGYYQPR